MFKGAFDKGKTFRPKRNHKVGTKRYELHKYAQATLGAGNLRDAVTLPEGEDVSEWLAVNTVDFFNEINLLYGIIAEFCTELLTHVTQQLGIVAHVFATIRTDTAPRHDGAATAAAATPRARRHRSQHRPTLLLFRHRRRFSLHPNLRARRRSAKLRVEEASAKSAPVARSQAC